MHDPLRLNFNGPYGETEIVASAGSDSGKTLWIKIDGKGICRMLPV